MGMLRPDTGPILLDCLGKEGCYGVPNECLLELTSFGLTPEGQAFYDECTLNGECSSTFCVARCRADGTRNTGASLGWSLSSV